MFAAAPTRPLRLSNTRYPDPTMPASPRDNSSVSDETRYALYNLHPPATMERLVRVLTSLSPTRLIEIIGAPGSGRSYLLEAACIEARRRGTQVTLVELDFDGCEPDTPLADYTALRIAKAEAEESDRLEYLKELATAFSREPDTMRAGCHGVVGIGLGVALDLPIEQVAQYVRSKGEGLGELVAPATRRGPTVLHAADGLMLDRPSRRMVLEEVQRQSNLFLATGHEAPPPADTDSERIFIGAWSEEEMRERIRERFAPCTFPRDFHEALWQASGGEQRQQVASLLMRLTEGNAIRRDGFGTWSVVREWRKDRTVMEELSGGGYGRIEEALAGLSEEQEGVTIEFLRMAALCHPVIPVNLLLSCAGVAPDEQSDFLDECIDERLGTEGKDAVFQDLGYSHPAFPIGLFPARQLVYRFRDTLLPETILSRTKAARRDEVTRGLLGFLEQAAPPVTKGLARLRLRVSAHVDLARERERLEHIVAWWAGEDGADALREELIAGMRDGHFSPEFLMNIYRQTSKQWPFYRQLALLGAYENQPGGLPDKEAVDVWLQRGALLRASGRDEEAIELAKGALEAAAERQDGNAYLSASEFLGYVLLERERYSEAEPVILEALAIAEKTFGASDPRTSAWVNNVGRLRLLQDRVDEALPLLDRALEGFEKSLGREHPATVALTAMAQAVRASRKE